MITTHQAQEFDDFVIDAIKKTKKKIREDISAKFDEDESTCPDCSKCIKSINMIIEKIKI